MSDTADLRSAAERLITLKASDFESADQHMKFLTLCNMAFREQATPEVVLALIAENEALKGPHDWLAEDLIKELVDNAQAIQENADDGEEDPFVIVLLASASRIRRQEANIDQLRAENAGLKTGYEAYERVNAELKAEVEALRKEREGKVLCDLELFETLRDSANTEADEHRQCMATYRPLRQASLDSVVKKCDELLAAMGQGEQS